MSDYSDVKSRASLQEYAEQNLRHVANGLVCPACQSGTKSHRTPALSIKGERWKCFACGTGGDIFDLAGEIYGLTKKTEQLEAIKQWLGETDSSKQTEAKEGNNEKRQLENYREATKKNIDDPRALDYLKSRGYTREKAIDAGLGYDPTSKRIVIPWRGSTFYWISRDITGKSTRKYEKPKAAEAGQQPLWNPDALKAGAFFVVEGPFDALALEDLGYEAVALGGVGASALLAEMSKTKSKSIAILMLDGDEAGRKAQTRIASDFEESGLPYIDYGGDRYAKDADEMWQKDAARLKGQLEKALQDAREVLNARLNAQKARAIRSLRVQSVQDIAGELLDLEEGTTYTSTGIRGLDEMLDGGLRPGLTVLAAASSLGKTTLAVQIADFIARNGYDVLFVTLEQSARDLVLKSLSRGCYEASGGEMCVSTRDVAEYSVRSRWTTEQNELFSDVVAAYKQNVSGHLEVLEGIGKTSVDEIATYAQAMAQEGRTPVIFVDYLQLLSNDGIQDERISINRSVTALRRMARDLETPVVCISAVRRESYLLPVTLDSMKESGAIEYGADVVLGLQTAGVDMGETTGPDRKARREADRRARQGKAAEYRAVELVVLKQREGRVHGADQAIALTFVPQASLFV